MEWPWMMHWGQRWSEPEPSGSDADRQAPSTSMAVDLELLRLYYGTVAARLACTRCGARLGRAVLVKPAAGYVTIGAISATTRCRGWRRHFHRATVTGRAADRLEFGDLLPA